jgi:hypothetical protein
MNASTHKGEMLPPLFLPHNAAVGVTTDHPTLTSASNVYYPGCDVHGCLGGLARLSIGEFVEPGLRDGTVAALEAIGRLECGVCTGPLGASTEWLIPCVNYHAVHRACLAGWVRHNAPWVGAAFVKCPECTVVLTYPNGDGAEWRQLALDATTQHVAEADLENAQQRDEEQEMNRREQEMNRHQQEMEGLRRQGAANRVKGAKLDLLDWWSAVYDDPATSPSVVDPMPPSARRIQLYPSTPTRGLEFARYGAAELRRRDAIAEEAHTRHEEALRLIYLTVYGALPERVDLLTKLYLNRMNLRGELVPPHPPREIVEWIDEYRIRERELLNVRMEVLYWDVRGLLREMENENA